MNKIISLIILFVLVFSAQSFSAQTKVSSADLELTAENFTAEQNYDGALEIYSKLIDSNPSKKKKYEYFLLMGDVQDRQGNYSAALGNYYKAAELYKKNEVNLKIGDALLKSNLYTIAERNFLDVLSKNKRSDYAKRRLGDIYLKQGNYLKAIEYYEAVDHFYVDRNTIMNMSKAYKNVGRSNKAIELIDRQLKYSDDAEILILLGTLYAEAKDYAKAEESILASIALDDKNFVSYLYAASIFEGKNEFAKAKTYLLKVSKLNPNLSLTDLLLSKIAYKMNDLSGAKFYAASAVKKASAPFVAEQAQRMLDFYNGKK